MSQSSIPELNPPARILLGPGPSNVSPRVLRAMTAPLLGYLDPDFLEIMNGVADMLREVFGTQSGFTLPISGTGSAGMEAGIANLLEPDDIMVVAANGFFGDRMAEMGTRQGATVIKINTEWGKVVDVDQVRQELERHTKVKVLSVVHAETSTGVLQPLEELSQLARDYDALFLVDAVTSMGANPIDMDRNGIDFCYAASQKCLGAPPGLAPVGISNKALNAIENRKSPPRTWYLDIGLLRSYWNEGTRVYHHTAPVTMIYALREALRTLLEEGLTNSFDRHTLNGRALRAGLEALGLQTLVPEPHCTYQLTSVQIPDGIDDAAIRNVLLREYNMEIGGGLGVFKGNVWRIGLMGESSKSSNVLLLLSILEKELPKAGFEVAVGSGVAAASKILSN